MDSGKLHGGKEMREIQYKLQELVSQSSPCINQIKQLAICYTEVYVLPSPYSFFLALQ
jgi:hypothetical protein